ncbi:MAG: efflux RND transporter periplasmic adaptor subunit [Acidobacteria bacterium]|nr:efflux RND transporter periplasmic adaptor subunit [Acidobacteriota bacterium]
MPGRTHTTETNGEAAVGRQVEAPPEWMPEPPSRLKSSLRTLLIIVLIGAAALAFYYRVLPGLTEKPPQDVLMASGRIEGREITLAAKEIQARVKSLLVDEGDDVKKGQLVAELEANQLESRFAGLQANIAALDVQIRQASIDAAYTAKNSAASVAAAEAAVSSAKARLERARSVLNNAKLEQERAVRLHEDQVVSRSVLDQASMRLETSQADVNAAEKELAQAEANLTLAQASKGNVELKIEQLHALEQSRRAAQAQLAEAQANLAERNIYVPSDGTILSRAVEPGDVVSPGSPIFVMVDMNRLYLKVYIPEPDIPKLKLGQPAEISVDAFPGKTFPARITRIYNQAEFTPKNVETKEERVKMVFGVELGLENPDRLLKPGMPADCLIRWKDSAIQPESK